MADDDLKLDEFAPEDGALPDTFAEEKNAGDLATVFDVPVAISAVLGRSSMSVAQLLQLADFANLGLRRLGDASG